MSIYILEKLIELLAAFLTIMLARWLYGISTPENDYRRLQAIFYISPKWYRGIELWHQIRGAILLRSV